MAKLAELCKVDWGDTSLTKASYKDGGEYLGVSAAGCDGRMDYYDYDAFTPVISAIGANCGKLFLPKEPFVAIKNTIILKPNNSVSGKYLYYALLNNRIPKRGGGQPFISKGDTEQYEIPCFNRKEQEQIVDLFDSLSETINRRKTQLDVLDELIKARFVEMFGDPDLSRPKHDWKPISSIGTVVGGATPKTSNDEYWDGGYRWLTPAELETASWYVFDSVRKLTDAGVKSCSLTEMPVGTVILSSRAPIGKVAIAGKTFYCNQGFKNIICNDEVHPIFLYSLLVSNNEYLNSLGRGATFKEISKSIVERIKIPVPSYSEQEVFAEFCIQVNKSKAAVQKALDEAQLLFGSLMQQYFG